ncbi:MAG: ATP-binding protein [Povalibacter sp.]
MQNILTPTQDDIDSMLRLLADQAGEHAIFLMDPKGTVLWCNSGAERIFNASRESLVGETLARIFVSEDRDRGIDELERVVASASAISEDDRWHVRADGSRFWSSGALLALRDQGGRIVGYGKILRDRTDSKEQHEFMSNSLRELQARNESKDLAITKISHELRNVFAGINMGLQLIAQRQAGAVQSDVAELMRQQLELVQRLTEDLLDAKRLNASKVTLNRETIVLQDVLHDACMQLQLRCQERSVAIQRLTPPAPVEVSADRIRLQQIFANLLDNAIKYTQPGGHIWLKMTIEDHDAVVHVEDNGKGIPPDMLSQIFEMFTQVDPNSSSRGLGLGLALVHELVQLHGGSVQATSKGVGMGSEFTVRLPMAHPEGPHAP